MESMKEKFLQKIKDMEQSLEDKEKAAKDLEGKVSTAEYELKIQEKQLVKQKVIAENLHMEQKQDKGAIKTLTVELEDTKLRLVSAENKPHIEINNLESPLMTPVNTDTGKGLDKMMLSRGSQNAE
jgi:chromosome segregation ATPase